MASVNLFLLLPECNPVYNWMNNTAVYQNPEMLNQFIVELDAKLKEISIEKFNGYYDLKNVRNFLEDFNILEDYYPFPAKRLLTSAISSFDNWRDDLAQSDQVAYSIFSQSINDHTFIEVAERQHSNSQNYYFVLNHHGHSPINPVRIECGDTSVKILTISEKTELIKWFADNRRPARNFHTTSKHGENRQEIRIVNGKTISPLRCSVEHGRLLLQDATGHTIDELFNIDGNYFIVYKFEGDNPQNLYHGYHVDLESTEVPSDIRQRLRAR